MTASPIRAISTWAIAVAAERAGTRRGKAQMTLLRYIFNILFSFLHNFGSIFIERLNIQVDNAQTIYKNKTLT